MSHARFLFLVPRVIYELGLPRRCGPALPPRKPRSGRGRDGLTRLPALLGRGGRGNKRLLVRHPAQGGRQRPGGGSAALSAGAARRRCHHGPCAHPSRALAGPPSKADGALKKINKLILKKKKKRLGFRGGYCRSGRPPAACRPCVCSRLTRAGPIRGSAALSDAARPNPFISGGAGRRRRRWRQPQPQPRPRGLAAPSPGGPAPAPGAGRGERYRGNRARKAPGPAPQPWETRAAFCPAKVSFRVSLGKEAHAAQKVKMQPGVRTGTRGRTSACVHKLIRIGHKAGHLGFGREA